MMCCLTDFKVCSPRLYNYMQLNLSKIDYGHMTMARKRWPPLTVMSSATNLQDCVQYEGHCSCGKQFVLQCPLTVDVCGGSES